jgi:hypothetical protein
MNRIFFACIVAIACNNQPKKENVSVSKDSPSIQKRDSSYTDHSSVSLRLAPQSHVNIDFLSPLQFNDTTGVKRIQQIVITLNSSKIKDSVYLENEDFMENSTDGGGSLTGYFQNGNLVKIDEWYGISWGVLQVSYYFDNSSLVFVRETEDHFYIDDSTGIDPSRFDSQFRGEYYFNKGKLFDEVSLGHNRFENEENNPEKEFNQRAKENKDIILKHLAK